MAAARWLLIALPIWMLRHAWRFPGVRKLAWLVVQVTVLCFGVAMFASQPEQMLGALTSTQGLVLLAVVAFLMGRTSQGRRRATVAVEREQQGWQQARPYVQKGMEHGGQVIQLAAARAERKLKLRHRTVLAYMAVGERVEEVAGMGRCKTKGCRDTATHGRYCYECAVNADVPLWRPPKRTAGIGWFSSRRGGEQAATVHEETVAGPSYPTNMDDERKFHQRDRHKFHLEDGRAACACGWVGRTRSQREWLGHVQSLHQRVDNQRWN